MNALLHICRFDVLRLRWWLLGWLVLSFGLELGYHAIMTRGQVSADAYLTLYERVVFLELVRWFVMVWLTIEVNSAHSPVGPRQVWLTQAVPRWALAISRPIVVFLLLLGPWALARWIAIVSFYEPAPGTAAEVMLQFLATRGMAIALALFFASQARSTGGAIGAALLWFVGLYTLTMLAALLASGATLPGPGGAADGDGKLAVLLGAMVLALGCVGLQIGQFFHRRRVFTILGGLLAVALAVWAMIRIPVDFQRPATTANPAPKIAVNDSNARVELSSPQWSIGSNFAKIRLLAPDAVLAKNELFRAGNCTIELANGETWQGRNFGAQPSFLRTRFEPVLQHMFPDETVLLSRPPSSEFEDMVELISDWPAEEILPEIVGGTCQLHVFTLESAGKIGAGGILHTRIDGMPATVVFRSDFRVLETTIFQHRWLGGGPGFNALPMLLRVPGGRGLTYVLDPEISYLHDAKTQNFGQKRIKLESFDPPATETWTPEDLSKAGLEIFTKKLDRTIEAKIVN